MNKVGIFYGFWSETFDADFVAYVRKVHKLGFDAIELVAQNVLDMPEKSRGELLAVSQDLGVDLVFAADPPEDCDITHPDATVRQRGMDRLIQYFEIIHEMKGDTACGIVNGIWNSSIIDSREAHTQRSISCMRKLAPIAADYGVNICLELVNRYEHYMLNTAGEALEYLNQVDCPNLKIQFDTYHMNIEEDDFTDAILLAGDRLGYIHLGENNRRPAGRGPLPWTEIFSALHKIGYEGRITLEPLIKKDGDIGSACKIWRDIMPGIDYDAEAVKSLQFVRQKLQGTKL